MENVGKLQKYVYKYLKQIGDQTIVIFCSNNNIVMRSMAQ